MQRRTEDSTITVPDRAEVKVGTLWAIIRLSDVPQSEFD